MRRYKIVKCWQFAQLGIEGSKSDNKMGENFPNFKVGKISRIGPSTILQHPLCLVYVVRILLALKFSPMIIYPKPPPDILVAVFADIRSLD